MVHTKVNFKNLYYGFPVFLFSTIDKTGHTNIAPLSSSWALGDNIVIGVGVGSKTFENLKQIPEAVINLPDETLYERVEKIASYTGQNPISNEKLSMGYTYTEDKFLISGFTPEPSVDVKPDKIKEAPIQIETKVVNINLRDWFAIIELKAVGVYASKDLITDSLDISVEKWKPLIYKFRKYYGIGNCIGKNFRFK